MSNNIIPVLPPHNYDALFRAWLDGKEIQQKFENVNEWRFKAKRLTATDTAPFFAKGAEWYRVKPATATLTAKYRRYLYSVDKYKGWPRGGAAVNVANETATFNAAMVEEQRGFVAWIDKEWVTASHEIEVTN